MINLTSISSPKSNVLGSQCISSLSSEPQRGLTFKIQFFFYLRLSEGKSAKRDQLKVGIKNVLCSQILGY